MTVGWELGPGIIVLPDGRRVRGRSLRRSPAEAPAFGVYLQAEDPGPFPWDSRWVRWPDFRLPADPADAIAALVEAHGRAGSERVELACSGGVGRTGAGLAILARLSGVADVDAVAWIRSNYHRRAVETPWQRRWVRRVALPG